MSKQELILKSKLYFNSIYGLDSDVIYDELDMDICDKTVIKTSFIFINKWIKCLIIDNIKKKSEINDMFTKTLQYDFDQYIIISEIYPDLYEMIYNHLVDVLEELIDYMLKDELYESCENIKNFNNVFQTKYTPLIKFFNKKITTNNNDK